MLAVRRQESPRKVFLYLYAVSDQDGLFELDAAQIAQQTGLSRKTVYEAIAFLQKVRLLFLVEARTGRGKHSVYRLNWRKPAKKRDSQKKEKRASEIAEKALQKKCHPLSIKSKKEIHPSGDGPSAMLGDIISPVNRRQWNRCMRAFREALGNSQLPRRYLRTCVGVLGRHLKGKARSYALRLFEKLRALAHKLKVPDWVGSLVELCRWFMGLLKSLLKSKPRPRRRRFRDYNEYLRYLHEREVEQVRLKRAEYEGQQSWAERVQEWARQQLAELAWRKKQAELARQRLSAL